MTTHPGVWLMRALAPLPLPWLRALGGVLGRLLFALARRRRHIALVNLRLAFPAWSEAERMDVARRSFIAFAQSFIDRAWVWHAPDAVVRQRIRLTGAVDELRRPEAAVLFAPHFYGMDAGGAAIMQQAATVPSLPRLARLGRARVVPTVTRMTPGGYEVQVHPAWSGYPGDDPVADTALMNRRLEDWIRAMPEQYYWVHKRFKTRPAGEPSVYGRAP